MKIFFMSLTFIFICSHKINSQELNKKHTVKKGETVYRISKIYNVSVEGIFALNSNSREVIYVNDVLIIPNSSNSALITTNSEASKTNSKLNDVVYVVKKGDTKYGLSKKYGISIAQLERNNPQIVNGLQAEHILNIKASKKQIDSQNTNPKTYLVQKGDNKYRLSKNFNTTIEALELLNPEIVKMLHYGIIINIPQGSNTSNYQSITNKSITDDSDKINSEDLVSVINQPNEVLIGYTDLKRTINTSASRKVLFVLPFTKDEYEEHLTNTTSVNDSFLKHNIHFYKGAKIAIDSVKKLGLKFEVDVLKINHKNTEENDLSFNSNLNILESYHGILSPFFKDESEIISKSVLNKNIPVITLYKPANIKNPSNLYEALPSKNTQKIKLINHLNAKKGNIVLISDINRNLNKNILLEQAPTAKIVHVSRQGELLNSELISALDKNNINYVIIDSQRNSVFLNSTNLLLKRLSDYDIQIAVMESSLIPDSKNLSYKRFKVLNLIYPSHFQDDNDLNKKPESILNYETTLNLGFDITFDTLLRLSQSNNFETSAINNKTKYGTLSFDYKKLNSDSYSNKEAIIIEYNNEESIKKQDD